MNLLLAVLLLCPAFAVAQPRERAGTLPEERQGFYFNKGRTRQRIPFEFRSNLIIVPVRINQSDTVRFIVDTGVSYTIITAPDAFRRHPLPLSRTVKLTGIGDAGTLTASVSIGNTIRLGALQADHRNFIVLTEDILHLSDYAGVPIHGIIGYELFANLVVTIDFQHREIRLIDPGKYRYHPRKGGRYPITLVDSKAYTDALSVGDGIHPVPLRVVLDTGAGQALLLDRFQNSLVIPVPTTTVRVSLGRGLNGYINGEVGRLPHIRFGRHRLNNVLAAYPDSSDYSQKLNYLPSRQGSIGCELLRRFRMTFNYPARYIVLKPVKRLLRQPFEHDMSGLELRARGSRLNEYFIDNVVANSPAERAGFQAGDELLVVNGFRSGTLTLPEIFRMFQAGEGKSVFLLVQRNRQLIPGRFVLKRLI